MCNKAHELNYLSKISKTFINRFHLTSKNIIQGERYLMEIEKEDLLLTIAIPTYNRKNLLKRALESIIPQLNHKIEVLVSDNASDDGTDEMMSESFPMVRYIKNETNKGWDYNFLQCYKKAKGKYVIILGSDDRMAAGCIDYLNDFLERNDCDTVFINYRFYDITKKEVYIKNGEWIKNYKAKQDIVTMNRNQFIKYAGHSITFISTSIVKKSLVANVANPERFFGTDFIHTCMMFEGVKGKETRFGVIMQPLIEANATTGDSEMSKKPDKTVTVFGKHMYWLFCNHAVECGFSKKQMKKVYWQYLHNHPFWRLLLSYKRNENMKAIENFWQDGYPVVKHFPSEWIKVILVALTPRCIINVMYKIYKTFKKDK